MLDGLKQWGLRFINSRELEIDGVMAAELVRIHDLRGTTRPFKNMRLHAAENNGSVLAAGESSDLDEEVAGKSLTCCVNCREMVEKISDCSICLEPFQKSGISSCQKCGNLICWSCVQRLFSCPFCRVNISFLWQRNIALEKLVNDLELPCRSTKWGCKLRLVKNPRTNTENKSQLMPIYCPLKAYCNWRGDINNLSHHLADAHFLTLLAGNRITVEISSFRAKLKQSKSKSQKYIVLLNCFSMFFFCKLTLYRRKLSVVFMQIPDNNSIESFSFHNRKFNAWVEVSSPFRTIKGIVPINLNSKVNKEVHVPCESLLSPQACADEKVRIGILVY